MEENENDENVKKIMHVMRNAPHGTIYTYEGLEMILIMAAYEQEISVVFIDDGVYALKKGQDTEGTADVIFMRQEHRQLQLRVAVGAQ